MLIGDAKLVTDISTDAGLNAAGTHGDQQEPNNEAIARMFECERQVAKTIYDRQGQDRAVFTQDSVSENCSKNRKKIDAGDKRVVPGIGQRIAEVIRFALRVEHVSCHE